MYLRTMLYNMSESTYVISSCEGCKILSIEYEEKESKRDLNTNREGVKYYRTSILNYFGCQFIKELTYI